MPLSLGTRFGPYEIAALIGVGGMGEVYRARDTNLRRDVAIKILPDFFAGDAERLARFRREAETLASLNHQNIAHFYGRELAEATTALVMELVEGPTLAERIARGAIPPAEALSIALQIADALEAAHERAIVHRDLKPANINARLAALVPPPRMHLTRYHGVFAPHHALRAAITPAGRGRGARPVETAERPVSKHVAMSWAQRLKRVFAIDIESCRRCGGKLRVIASIEDPALIERILAHLEQPPGGDPPRSPFTPRAPPQPLPLC